MCIRDRRKTPSGRSSLLLIITAHTSVSCVSVDLRSADVVLRITFVFNCTYLTEHLIDVDEANDEITRRLFIGLVKVIFLRRDDR